MTTGSSQLVRQWLLLKKLCVSHTGKTVAELSRELEVTAKTIQRDLAVFHDAGFPIEQTAATAGRKSYHIVNGLRQLFRGLPRT
ncbi:MAG: HTH domain-containing protein [Planctomycetota bacterium]